MIKIKFTLQELDARDQELLALGADEERTAIVAELHRVSRNLQEVARLLPANHEMGLELMNYWSGLSTAINVIQALEHYDDRSIRCDCEENND